MKKKYMIMRDLSCVSRKPFLFWVASAIWQNIQVLHYINYLLIENNGVLHLRSANDKQRVKFLKHFLIIFPIYFFDEIIVRCSLHRLTKGQNVRQNFFLPTAAARLFWTTWSGCAQHRHKLWLHECFEGKWPLLKLSQTP